MKEETKSEELKRRMKEALESLRPLPEQEPLNSFLEIENLKSGLKISLLSSEQDMASLFELSKQIKKEFF